MKRDFNTAISLGLYRLVERGWTCSIHDKDFIRFEQNRTNTATYENYNQLTKAYNGLPNFSSKRNLIIVKPLISQEPNMNPILASESGTLGARVIIYDRQKESLVDMFIALGINSKTYTPEYGMTKDDDLEDAVKELQRDLVSGFKSKQS